jgi:cytochrome c oxidase subunit 3
MLFVVLQGREWWGLLSQGVTMQSSTLGAFFYLIVGTHAVHAVVAIAALTMTWSRMRRGTLSPGFVLGAQTFWYFVVGIWPVIYFRVYF